MTAKIGAGGLRGRGDTAQRLLELPPEDIVEAGTRGPAGRHTDQCLQWGGLQILGMKQIREMREGKEAGVSHTFHTCTAVWILWGVAAHFRMNLAKEKGMHVMEPLPSFPPSFLAPSLPSSLPFPFFLLLPPKLFVYRYCPYDQWHLVFKGLHFSIPLLSKHRSERSIHCYRQFCTNF